jgi:hypothetical protein
MRVLYCNTFLMMTTKFIVFYSPLRKPPWGFVPHGGKARREPAQALWVSRRVLKHMLKSRRTMHTAAHAASRLKGVNDTSAAAGDGKSWHRRVKPVRSQTVKTL